VGGHSEVDPIVASFFGGAMGIITSVMVVELNNVKQQEHKRCKYCHGTGTSSHSFWLFHVWCFWWVSASYDSLKLNWFCLAEKGLPDTQMTQRIQIHILFDNQKIHYVCWRLNTNS
jgi:hypothetical protein